MALTKLEENLNTIENLSDSPTLESLELRRKFDESSIKIKEYINDILTEEIDKLITSTKKEINNTINNNKNTTEKTLQEQLKKRYYVGRIIMDTKNVNPASYLGFGTWQLWGSGRVPVGVNASDSAFNAVEKTGGEKVHVLTEKEMPKHGHKMYDYLVAAQGGGSVTVPSVSKATGAESYTTSSGGGVAHNNLQPYITCYMWKRVS